MFGVLGISFLSGVGGTGIGGLLSTFIAKGNKARGVLLSLTAGIMLSIVCFDLIPEAVSSINVFVLSVSVILGGLFVRFAENLITKLKRGEKNKGVLVALAIALHNFPEGIIIGASHNSSLSASTAILVALHDIPEGMAAALPFSEGKKGRLKGVLYAVLSGIPTVLGAVLGYCFSNISGYLCALVVGFSAGAMIYVVFSELIPLSYDLKENEFSGIMIIIGILLGLIIIGLV